VLLALAQLLVLREHPRRPESSGAPSVEPLTSAATSLAAFVEPDVEVTGRHLQPLGRLANRARDAHATTLEQEARRGASPAPTTIALASPVDARAQGAERDSSVDLAGRPISAAHVVFLPRKAVHRPDRTREIDRGSA
jgi:hypothetical protein